MLARKRDAMCYFGRYVLVECAAGQEIAKGAKRRGAAARVERRSRLGGLRSGTGDLDRRPEGGGVCGTRGLSWKATGAIMW